jgi:hypothetical protein
MLPQLHHLHSPAHQPRSHRRAQHLTARRQRHQAGRLIHRRPEIIPVALDHLTRVQTHTHPDGRTLRPNLGSQPGLSSQRRGHGVASPGEGHPNTIPTCRKHAPAAPFNRGRTIASWRSNATGITSGLDSHNLVDPSMSVNKNVTVPDGALTPAASHARKPPAQ